MADAHDGVVILIKSRKNRNRKMSNESTLYSPIKNKITLVILIQKLRKAGWEIAFSALTEDGKFTADDILTNGIIYSWKPETFTMKEASDLFTLNNQKEIDQKLSDGILATCELSVENDYSISDEYEEDEIEELTEDCGIDYVDQLRKTKSSFTTRTNYGCGPLSGEFHEVFCDVLQTLTNGIFDDE